VCHRVRAVALIPEPAGHPVPRAHLVQPVPHPRADYCDAGVCARGLAVVAGRDSSDCRCRSVWPPCSTGSLRCRRSVSRIASARGSRGRGSRVRPRSRAPALVAGVWALATGMWALAPVPGMPSARPSPSPRHPGSSTPAARSCPTTPRCANPLNPLSRSPISRFPFSQSSLSRSPFSQSPLGGSQVNRSQGESLSAGGFCL
jgi:hypothetical protein